VILPVKPYTAASLLSATSLPKKLIVVSTPLELSILILMHGKTTYKQFRRENYA
ncbi:hypothetical protein SCCGRSA3_01262, partial [Marine Group I thaumarchaeote SCGC RSA3]